jgi:Tfp pilus assembly protein PilF
MERVLFLPLAVKEGPGALTRAVAREIASRVAAVGGIETRFAPFVHIVEGRRVFGVYPERWEEADLRRFLDSESGFDLLVHGDLAAGDPFAITLEVLRTADLGRVVEGTFEAPRYDGFKVIEEAAKFVLKAAENASEDASLHDFPARKFEAYLDLLRGREAAAELDLWSAVEDPADLFEPFFDALDQEIGLTAAKEELAVFAAAAGAGGLVPIEAAKTALQRLVKLDPKSWRSFAGLAQVMGTAGDLRGAEDAFRKALDLDPGRATLRFDLGMVLIRQERTGRAAKILETVKSDPHLGAEAGYRLGLIRKAKGDIEGAVELFKTAAEQPDARPELFADLGRVLASEGHFDQAENAFRRGLSSETHSVELQFAYGLYLAEQDRFRDALPHLEKAVRLGGNLPEAHLHIGRCYAADGRRAQALHHLRKALRADDRLKALARAAIEDVAPAAHQGELVRMLDEAVARPAEEQVVLLKSLLKEESSFPEARNRLGIALLATGQSRKAEGQFKKALKQAPDDPEALSGMATALRARGKLKAAVAAHRKVLEVAPHHAGFHLNFADTLLRLGQVREALKEVETARALDPVNPLLPGFVKGVRLALSAAPTQAK